MLALSDAEVLRSQQAAYQAELVKLGLDGKLTRGRIEHFRGQDVEPIVAQLENDLRDLRQRRGEIGDRITTLESEVRGIEEELGGTDGTGGILARMQAVQGELLSLEKRGFKAGQDEGADGFEAYRENYRRLSRELEQLQAQEQELRYGGLHGAKLVGHDPSTARVRGGEPVVGLEELQWQLETSRTNAQRLDDAVAALEAYDTHVRKGGQDAGEEIRRHNDHLTDLTSRQKALLTRIMEVAGEAEALEDDALRSARSAESSFRQAGNTIRQWIGDARTVQQERDPERKNPRLNVLLKDPFIEQVGQSAQATAQLLTARIHASRVESAQSMINAVMAAHGMNDALEPAQDVGHVRPEHAAVGVCLVDHHEL